MQFKIGNKDVVIHVKKKRQYGESGGNKKVGDIQEGFNLRMGFTHDQSAWGNNFQGQEWLDEQKKMNQGKFYQPEQHKEIKINDFIENQIVFIEPSPSNKILEELIKNKKKFIDKNFAPDSNSLFGEYDPDENWSKITWKKVSEQMKNPKIFQGKVEPGDIRQGSIEDCYLLAALAALAERPDRIYNLFMFHEMNQARYYSVKLLFRGKWITIDLDDYVPYLNDQLIFAKSIKSELWVILMEKAWAKLYSSYKRIDYGFPTETLHNLTGAPCQTIKPSKPTEPQFEQNWKYLIAASQKQYPMVAGSLKGTNPSIKGIAASHAYTVLNATYLRVGQNEVKLMQLRDPWGIGKSQFKGIWSDGHPSWNFVDQSEKQRVGYNPDVDDGIFFMSYEDFFKQFAFIIVAELNDNASYVYKSYKDPKNKGAYFAVQIFEAEQYCFNIDQTPERFYTASVQNMFHYSVAQIQIGRFQGAQCMYLGGEKLRIRTLSHKIYLQPGTYVVWAKIDYDNKFQIDFDVNLAVYAPFACNVRLATKDEAISFSGDPNVEWGGEEQVQDKPWKSFDKNGWNNGW